MLYAEVPETSMLHISHLNSPMVTLGRYEGLSSDGYAPAWTCIPIGVPFELRQPRFAIARVFAELAMWPENAGVVCLHFFAFVHVLCLIPYFI